MSEATAKVDDVAVRNTAGAVLVALSFSHFLNDMMQSLLPAIYPMLKTEFSLSFGQVGLITFVYQITASLLQPVVGHYTDKKARPYSLSIGMGFTLSGLLLLAFATSFPAVLAAAMLIGTGSSVFHPEASRIARMASGGRHGFAQSFFQVGGNLGSAIGPLLAALIVIQRGQTSIAWFSMAAALGMVLLWNVGGWYKRRAVASAKADAILTSAVTLTRRQIGMSIAILLALIFSKYFYMASLSSYYTFYLIDKFHTPIHTSQIMLFVFLGAVAAGTIIGGPLGDRFGRRYVIWGSILGVLPFTLALPYANFFWTGVLTVPIGLILASAFPAIVVYAQELLPGRVGTVAGLFFGFAFGMGGLGAALLGVLADATSIKFVYEVCSFLPLLGLLAVFLPDLKRFIPEKLRTA
ncbi:MAG: MFS transporter [Parvibaculum sp.]|uniref:MFS transporter n=1 Tax=Parvibaculum sp. TaxID=2024848 RepID=UPI003C745E17